MNSALPGQRLLKQSEIDRLIFENYVASFEH